MTISAGSICRLLQSPLLHQPVSGDGYLGLIDSSVLIEGMGVDCKKFAARCINAVFNGIDLWACLISLESLDGHRRSVWAAMMQENVRASESDRKRSFYQLGQLYYSYDSISVVQTRRRDWIFWFQLYVFMTIHTRTSVITLNISSKIHFSVDSSLSFNQQRPVQNSIRAKAQLCQV